MEALIRPLVWLDFRLAVLFTVLVPLALLVGAIVQKSEAITRSLTIYWRVSCLLAITVYLLIATLPIGFLTGWIARILILLSLWYWQDLNEDIETSRSPVRFYYVAWRWAMTIYCSIGTLFGTLFLNCAFMSSENMVDRCRTLLEIPTVYKAIFHASVPEATLGFFAIVALIVYALYLGVFTCVSLPKQGRIAFRN